MNIGICEDDQRTRLATLDLIEELGQKDQQSLRTFSFESSEALLFALPELPALDLLILDIQMGELDGMSLAKKIRQNNQNVAILFVSNYDDYVFDGYDVNAIGYVMKPLTEDKLRDTLEKVAKASTLEAKTLVIEQEGQQRLYLYDIIYIEAAGHYLRIVTQEATFQPKSSLAKIAAQLDDDFIQVHRSYLVNLNFITALQGNELLLANGEKIPLARSQKKNVQTRFLAHYRGLADD